MRGEGARFAKWAWIEKNVGMQGSCRPDRELLDAAAALCGHLLGERSVHAVLAEHSLALFPDEMFADLFASGRGRPSVPADVIATVMVLQALEGKSDREACRALEGDIAWKAAAGLSLTDEAFHPTVPTLWRNKLRASGDRSGSSTRSARWSPVCQKGSVSSAGSLRCTISARSRSFRPTIACKCTALRPSLALAPPSKRSKSTKASLTLMPAEPAQLTARAIISPSVDESSTTMALRTSIPDVWTPSISSSRETVPSRIIGLPVYRSSGTSAMRATAAASIGLPSRMPRTASNAESSDSKRAIPRPRNALR